ncbi:hypothetical protein Tco_0368859 [Tanacetum coccineum]
MFNLWKWYTKECCSIGNLNDQIIVPNSSLQCAMCGTPVDDTSGVITDNTNVVMLLESSVVDQDPWTCHLLPISPEIVEVCVDDDDTDDDDDYDDDFYVDDYVDIEEDGGEIDLDISRIVTISLQEKFSPNSFKGGGCACFLDDSILRGSEWRGDLKGGILLLLMNYPLMTRDSFRVRVIYLFDDEPVMLS